MPSKRDENFEHHELEEIEEKIEDILETLDRLEKLILSLLPPSTGKAVSAVLNFIT
jgi:hypothetical protein